RQKREWIKFAAACREGEDNSKRNPIARIRSDCEENNPVTYSISGVGIDRAPYGIFVVNPRTGEINITSIVDREVTPVFVIRCFAKHSVTGMDLEPPLELRVRVLDINDNPPVFAQSVFTGSVEECSMDNTLVMKIIASDADEPNHLNSKIAFKIESQEPSGQPMFIMNKYTGELHLANYLDREQHSSYTLVVKASDRDGAADGISSHCSCHVKVIDVNDNFPTLAQSSVTSISENSLSSEILRIQALDADEEFSDNWLAEFFFISGNEDNYFEIVTDPATNQGILRVIKELNYEHIPTHSLSIGVRNRAEFHHSVMSQYQVIGTPLIVEVKNVIEPPRFNPSAVILSVPQRTRVNYVVGTYTAFDEDTGTTANNVIYSIGRDPGAWFRINQNTGEITLSKVIDWESSYVTNGQYTAEVLAITRGKKQILSSETKLFILYIFLNSMFSHLNSLFIVSILPPDHKYLLFTGIPRYTATGTIVLTMQDTRDNLIPILMSMSDCCGCGPGAAAGVGTGFEPVPECTEGAIHPWGIEGAQPEDRVSTFRVSKVHSGVTYFLFADIYTNTYGGGGVVASGVEETTGVGYGTGTGYGTAGGISGTGEAKGSVGGTIKEYREGGVNMAFLDNYFSEKAFVYADEDEGRPANDCLLIYDHEGIGTPVGSVGCCSFIGEDTDETYLETLGPKFKTLAEICLGKEIEPFPDANPPWPGINVTFPNSECDLNLPPPGTTILVNGSAPMAPPAGTTTVVTENTYTSASTVQPPRPMPDPLLHGNVTVTETYTSGSPSLCVDPLRASNVVVTERVVGPASASDLRGMLDIPDLADGSNVIVTERVIAPNSRLPASLSIPDLVDGSNVVVTERVFRPASGMPGSLINIPSELSNAHNVVVTERVVSGSGMSNLAGGGLGGASLGGLSSTGQMLNADCHLGQAMGTASPGTSRRRVTKYSTVQYSSQ
uniref:Desmoglein 1 n=1 Tax=Phasianus colchicus TaxID=9054 RepID=A0A669QPV0_PHACC